MREADHSTAASDHDGAAAMQHYFFHVHDGTAFNDADGTLLPSLEAARVMAVQYAGELLRDRGHDFDDGEDWKVDVADEHGLILFTVLLTALDAPAVRRGTRAPLSLG